jgi:hypothetical protein
MTELEQLRARIEALEARLKDTESAILNLVPYAGMNSQTIGRIQAHLKPPIAVTSGHELMPNVLLQTGIDKE